MFRQVLKYFAYLLGFIALLAIKTTFSEVLSCSFIPDPGILLSFILFDMDIKKRFKYLAILIAAFIYTQFSIGNLFYYFSAYLILFYVYQKIMATLNREDRYSVFISVAFSLFVYNIYTYLISFLLSESFRIDFGILVCNFLINLFFVYFVLFLIIKFSRRNNA